MRIQKSYKLILSVLLVFFIFKFIFGTTNEPGVLIPQIFAGLSVLTILFLIVFSTYNFLLMASPSLTGTLLAFYILNRSGVFYYKENFLVILLPQLLTIIVVLLWKPYKDN
jgi:hypothetical protein